MQARGDRPEFDEVGHEPPLVGFDAVFPREAHGIPFSHTVNAGGDHAGPIGCGEVGGGADNG